jgi:RNA polymerase sigma-70 factor (ECF subfamily)
VLEALGEDPVPDVGPTDEVAEARLFRAFGRGDEGAFESLYRRHASTVYGLSYRLTTRRADAEDLTQEVFFAAWEHRATFESPQHLLHWLRRVTVNRWLNRVRRKREFELDAEGTDVGGAGRIPEPEATPTHAPGVRIDLERALAMLSPRLRAVVLLFDLYGMEHAEIADALDITAGACKVQLHRARRRLREMLR